MWVRRRARRLDTCFLLFLPDSEFLGKMCVCVGGGWGGERENSSGSDSGIQTTEFKKFNSSSSCLPSPSSPFPAACGGLVFSAPSPTQTLRPLPHQPCANQNPVREARRLPPTSAGRTLLFPLHPHLFPPLSPALRFLFKLFIYTFFPPEHFFL